MPAAIQPMALTPRYVKTRVLSGLGDGLAGAEVGHDALVDLSCKEAFKASDDLAFGPASGGASGDVVAGWLVESPADDDGSIEGGVGLPVAASIEAVPAGGPPGRGRDRAHAAELRRQAFAAAERRDALFPAEPLQHDPNLLFG